MSFRLAVLLSLLAALAAAEPPAPTALTADQLQQDIQVLRTLGRWHLDGAQVAVLATAVKPLAELAEQRRAAANAPEVRRALLAIRAVAATGKPVDQALWEQVRAAQEAAAHAAAVGGEPVDDERLQREGQSAAKGFVKLLQPEQIANVAAPEAQEQAEDLCDQMREARNAPVLEWTKWRDDRLKELTNDRGDDKDTVLAALREVFDGARRLPPDDFFDQRAALILKFRAALLPRLDAAAMTQRAVDQLANQMVNNERFGPCVADFAAVVAAGK